MADKKRVIETRVIETRLELYNSFFDHAWAREMTGRVPLRLADAFDSLCLAWKEAANTHRLPWLMIHQMEQFAGGFMRRSQPDTAEMIVKFRDWLLSEMDGELKRVEKKAVIAAIKKIDQGLRVASQVKDAHFPAVEYWNDLIGKSEFRLSISGSQGQTFCALVFGYEWFLVGSFRALGGPEKYKPSEDRFWSEFGKLLGGDPKAVYWDDQAVRIARTARNSIAHLGGKAKPDLLAEEHGLFISPEGIISVQPTNNRDLFEALRAKVTQLVEEATPKLTAAA